MSRIPSPTADTSKTQVVNDLAEWLQQQVNIDEKNAHSNRTSRIAAFKRAILARHRTWLNGEACAGCGFDIHGVPVTPHINDCPELRAMANLVYPSRSGYQQEWQL